MNRSRRRRALPILATLAATALPEIAATAVRGEDSEAFKASIRHTIEVRNRRRRERAATPVGQMVPYPMPPALIIRHTPEVHDEVTDLLRLLRGGA